MPGPPGNTYTASAAQATSGLSVFSTRRQVSIGVSSPVDTIPALELSGSGRS